MGKELAIDRAIYLVDDEARTYRFLRRNPNAGAVDYVENLRNKRHIDGYTRMFRDGSTKVFRFRGS